jgi:hypothetical protein
MHFSPLLSLMLPLLLSLLCLYYLQSKPKPRLPTTHAWDDDSAESDLQHHPSGKARGAGKGKGKGKGNTGRTIFVEAKHTGAGAKTKDPLTDVPTRRWSLTGWGGGRSKPTAYDFALKH